MTAENGKSRFRVETLVLAATGSVGILALPKMITALKDRFARQVQVLMSESAQRFITPEAVSLFARNRVYTDAFAKQRDLDVLHVDLARIADLLVILPATANIMGKAAHGIADNLISTTILACRAPVVFVPSMNDAMWTDPIVQNNARKLEDLGYHIIPPAMGYSIADLQPSSGAMPGIDMIIAGLDGLIP